LTLFAQNSRVRRASLTTVANVSLAGARFVVSLATVSMLIRYLGSTSYGLCITITAMAGWLSVTQGGIGQSFRNEVIRLRAIGMEDQVAGLFSSAFLFLLGTMLVVGALLTAIAYRIPWNAVLNYPALDHDPRFFHLLLASLWIVLLTVPFGLVRAAYSAFQMEFKLAAPLLAGILISFAGFVTGIHRDWGLVGVISVSLAGTPIGLALGIILMPGLRSSVDFRSFRILLGPGIWFLIVEIAAIFIFQADIFLVNLILGPARAAAYALHLQLFLYVQSAAMLLISPYWPAFGEAWHNGEGEWLRARVRGLTRGTAILSCGLVAALLVAGPSLMQRWSHGEVVWNPLLAALMGANMLIQTVTGVSATALGALGIVRNPALFLVFQAGLNVSVCFWLIGRFGVIGGACGSLVAYAITSGWYVPWRLRMVPV
jgi:O-antigen/teichoic acid export membrane protein